MLQAEASELRAKVEKRNREVRELNQMLKAWEAMRHSKDKQIAELVERCRKFEEEAAEKSRAVEAMRRRVGRERSGSGSIEHTPTSVTRSVGRSQRAPKSATSAASSFAFGTSGRISVASRPSPVAFGQENPNAFGSASPAVKAFAGTAVESEGGDGSGKSWIRRRRRSWTRAPSGWAPRDERFARCRRGGGYPRSGERVRGGCLVRLV